MEALAQRYVTVHLSESAYKGLSGLLEDWMIGLARLWLTAYPVQLTLRSGRAPSAGRRFKFPCPISWKRPTVTRSSVSSSNESSVTLPTSARPFGSGSSTIELTSDALTKLNGVHFAR